MADDPQTGAQQIAPAPSITTVVQRSGGVNAGHVIATSALTGDITPILMWATHFPLQPLDNTTAGAIAALIVAVVGGGGFALFRTKHSRFTDTQQGAN